MKYLRNHKGVAASLIIGGGLVVGAFIMVHDIPLPTTPAAAVAGPSNDIATSVAQKDTDGDGLFDWEENLWGMNPRKVDTDGDGILDGEEVTQRAKDSRPEDFSTTQQNQNLNFTQSFSRDFFGDYLTARKNGPLSTNRATALLTQGIQKANFSVPNSVNTNNVRVIKLPSDTEIATYLKGVRALLIEASGNVSAGELALIQQAFEEEDYTLLEEINTLAEGHELIVHQMADMDVPALLMPAHQDLMLGSAQMHPILEALAQSDEDPLLALVALGKYQGAAEKIQRAINTMASFTTDAYE